MEHALAKRLGGHEPQPPTGFGISSGVTSIVFDPPRCLRCARLGERVLRVRDRGPDDLDARVAPGLPVPPGWPVQSTPPRRA